MLIVVKPYSNPSSSPLHQVPTYRFLILITQKPYFLSKKVGLLSILVLVKRLKPLHHILSKRRSKKFSNPLKVCVFR